MKLLHLFILFLTISITFAKLSLKNIYLKRKSIKGIQPDAQNLNQMIGNEDHGCFEFCMGNLATFKNRKLYFWANKV